MLVKAINMTRIRELSKKIERLPKEVEDLQESMTKAGKKGNSYLHKVIN